MQKLKLQRRLLVAVVTMACLAVSSVDLQADTVDFYIIPMVYDSIAVLEGQEIRVVGEYVSPDVSVLVTSFAEFLKRKLLPLNSAMLLEGVFPDSNYWNGGMMIVTGTVSSAPKPHPDYGPDTLIITITASSYEYLFEGWDLSPPPPKDSGVLEEEGQFREPDTACDPCKFAILVGRDSVGPGDVPSFWDEIARVRDYKISMENYCPENIYIHFDNPAITPEIPGQVNRRPCTQASIEQTHYEIAHKVAKCKRQKKCATVQKMFTNHGADSHDGNDGGVVLLDGLLSPKELKNMQQILIDSCCQLLYDEFVTCYGGDMLNGLKKLDNKNKTQIHANSSAPDDALAWGPTRGVVPYLKAKIECLERIPKPSYEECVLEAEKEYLKYLGKILTNRIKDSTKYANQLDYWNSQPPGPIRDILIAYYQALLEGARLDIADLHRQLGHEANGVGKGCPSWVRHTFHKYCECKEFVVQPGGRLVFNFISGGGCGNIKLYEKQEDGTWKRVKIWNWNLPGSYGYSEGNKKRTHNVPETSSGVYWVHNDDSVFTVTVESFCYQTGADDESNPEEFAGFSAGCGDGSSAEFDTITLPVYTTTGTDEVGFNLSNVPAILGPSGVGQYTAQFTALAPNQWWDDMAVYLNVLQVMQPGDLGIACPIASNPNTSVHVDTAGEYLVSLGAIDAPAEGELTFSTASGVDFEWDSWGFIPLVPKYPPGQDTIKIKIKKTHNTIQGQHEYVSVTLQENPVEMGGWDFLIAYDASALSFIEATPGQLLEDCGWEYFTYRYGVQGNCGDACPSGLMRIIAIAETNNGPYHPSCFILPPPFTLFGLDFLVTDDRTFECTYVPIRFFWMDCGDNTISSKTGDTLYGSDHVYDFDSTDITDLTYGFPTYFGIQEECFDSSQWYIDPETGDTVYKVPEQFIDFYNGGIDIVCAESLDTRGDINLNGVSNEVADAVLFSNYFIYGLSVFHINFDGQVAATDVNADGMVLTVGDLVYQIRIIVGDAPPYPKLAPVVATYAIDNGVVSVDAEMGAAYVVAEGNITPTLLADNMEMKYNYDADEDVTRILVFSMEKGQTFAGTFLDVESKVVSIEMATYEGAPVTSTLLPTEFALHQNFPNPFNPITTISFALPVATDYELVIYNVMGQEVVTFTGRSEPGIVKVDWDASNYASGVYLYKLAAGNFTDTKKMVLLK